MCVCVAVSEMPCGVWSRLDTLPVSGRLAKPVEPTKSTPKHGVGAWASELPQQPFTASSLPNKAPLPPPQHTWFHCARLGQPLTC